MKIRYSFTADTKDIHIILRDKLSRYEMKHNVGEAFDSLNKALEKGENLGYVKSEAYKLFEACQDLSKELYEIIEFIDSYHSSLESKQRDDEPSEQGSQEQIIRPASSRKEIIEDIGDSLTKISDFTRSLKTIKVENDK